MEGMWFTFQDVFSGGDVESRSKAAWEERGKPVRDLSQEDRLGKMTCEWSSEGFKRC